MSSTLNLEQLLERAVWLARRGTGYVEPNPRVGALVVKDGEVVGEGWHREYGGPHAEINAIKAAGGAAKGADLVVSLEPCSTAGKTPACTEAIIEAGIARVFYASEDPNPENRGKAKAALEKAGIAVSQIEGHAASDALLEAFRVWLKGELPWTVLKWGMSADGKVATSTGESRWITSEESRREVHAERARSDAVLVGRATVKADDPMLTVRAEGLDRRSHPTRIVLDSGLHLDPNAQIVQTAGEIPTWIFHCAGLAGEGRREDLEALGVKLLAVPEGDGGRLDPLEAMRTLRKQGMHRVLVEGGPTVHGALLTAGLGAWARVYVAPMLIGGITAPGPVAGAGFPELDNAVWLDDTHLRIVGEGGSDFVIEGRIGNFRERVEV